MRGVPSGLLIDAETLSLATGWRVTLTDTTVLGFTDHDRDVPLGGLVYLASSGYTASAVETSGALNVDNLDVAGMLQSPSITEQDLHSGRWDYAEIETFRFNWRNPSAGRMYLRYGRLGEIKASGGRFSAELRGLTQQLAQQLGQMYQPACRADFGDAKCKFNAASVTFAATVDAVSANGLTLTASALAQPAGYFTAGKLRFTGGANAGFVLEVKDYAPGSIVLQLPTAFPPLGDAFDVTAGCQKRRFEDCRDKFANVVNFRGEPDLPGVNRMVLTPVRR